MGAGPGRDLLYCHRTSPTWGGNTTTGCLSTRTRGRLELCTSTCSSLRFLRRLVLTRIIGTCIKVRGGPQLLLLLGLQYLLYILIFFLLVAIVFV